MVWTGDVVTEGTTATGAEPGTIRPIVVAGAVMGEAKGLLWSRGHYDSHAQFSTEVVQGRL